MTHRHTCLDCGTLVDEGDFDCETDADHDSGRCGDCAATEEKRVRWIDVEAEVEGIIATVSAEGKCSVSLEPHLAAQVAPLLEGRGYTVSYPRQSDWHNGREYEAIHVEPEKP